jgi:hypothetical protein
MTTPTPTSHNFTNQAIEEFIRIYKRVYRKQLTLDEGRAMATRVINSYLLLAEDEARGRKKTGEVRNGSNPAPESPSIRTKTVRFRTSRPRLVQNIVKHESPRSRFHGLSYNTDCWSRKDCESGVPRRMFAPSSRLQEWKEVFFGPNCTSSTNRGGNAKRQPEDSDPSFRQHSTSHSLPYGNHRALTWSFIKGSACEIRYNSTRL